MKIGLLLGSFDPITVGHLHMISCVLNGGLCDKVLVVVAQHNPWKKNNPAPFDIRCQMVEASIKGFGDKCEVCRFEKEFEPPVYSYLPITKAMETYPNDELYLIGGEDTMRKLPNWKNFDTHIKDKIDFIELSRGESKSFRITKDCLKDDQLFRVWFDWSDRFGEESVSYKMQIQRIDISSTIVRNIVAGGMSPYPYVTEEVCKIIKENKLYR